MTYMQYMEGFKREKLATLPVEGSIPIPGMEEDHERRMQYKRLLEKMTLPEFCVHIWNTGYVLPIMNNKGYCPVCGGELLPSC